ncbi:unnamed protein product [Rhizophagus irregularis]|nr:unnamed protein product [Rhizophagus irregularis]
MNLIIEQIKTLLLLPLSNNSPSSSTLTSLILLTLPIIAFNTLEIYQEIKNAAAIFILIEEVKILENDIENNNNQTKEDKINLNKLLETKDLLDKIKKDLYNTIIKSINNKVEGKEILHKKYKEYKENYLPTPNKSHVSSSTPSESSVILNPIYKPRFFLIFEHNQPKASNEVEEYLKEDKISFNQCPFNW